MAKPLPGLPLHTGKVKSPEDAVRVLNRLQPSLQSLASAVNYGPVSGAYFPFTFGLETVTVGTELDGQVTPVEFRPVALTLWATGGIVTVDINAGGSSILTTALSSSAGSLTGREDFSVDTVARNTALTMDIDSVNGTPGRVRVVLWAQQLGRLIDTANVSGVKAQADSGSLTLTGQGATVTVT